MKSEKCKDFRNHAYSSHVWDFEWILAYWAFNGTQGVESATL